MEYRLLTEDHLGQIAQRKLLDLETEHAALELDLRLARATGVQNENVGLAEVRLELLVKQIATLTSWVMPPRVETAIANGHREAD